MNKQFRNRVFCRLVIIVFFLLPTYKWLSMSAVAQKPNVIIVLTDDQGYGDLSANGNPELMTPNMDFLHDHSIRLTDFHVAPMCTPTRGELMTGMDAMHNGAVYVNRRSMIRKDVPTMADIFQNNGYRTGLFGKWHLGDSYPYRPIDRGFDTVIRLGAWGITSIADYFGNDRFDDTFLHNGKYELYKGYSGDVWFRQAMQWMQDRSQEDNPFFCYLATNSAHVPHWVADHYSDPYKDVEPSKFYGMLSNLDENLGKLLRFLKRQNLENDTILIFMSDNGTAAGEMVYNAGMRGKKKSYYEGGHRVPFFIRWPAGELRNPGDLNNLTEVQDILPTLIDLCNLQASENTNFDGISLAPLLRGNTDKLPNPDRTLVVQYGIDPDPIKYNAAVLHKKWRLVGSFSKLKRPDSEQPKFELYNIAQDPGQRNNIATNHPKIYSNMKKYYEKWWDKALPVYRKIPHIKLGAKEENPMMLYSTDWQGDYADNWGGLGPGNKFGKWYVNVVRAGHYKITLYRWPPESHTPLDAELDGPQGKGIARSIDAAHLSVGGYNKIHVATPNANSITFDVDLKAGEQILNTEFLNKNGNELCSAYYIKVEMEPE